MTYITNIRSVISTNNVRTSSLSGDVSYSGTMEDVTPYASVTINIKSDQSSANGGISIEFGPDASTQNIKITDTYIAPGNYSKTYNVQAPYFRVVYTNGNVNQTSFNLQCILNGTKMGNGGQNQTVSFPEASYDAFARIRTSSPYTLFQVSHNTGKQMHDISEKLEGGAISTYQSDQSAVDLQVYASDLSIAIRQSRQYITYQPGKSFLFMATGVLNPSDETGSNQEDCISRIGLFDDNNGIYFQHTSNVISTGLRSSISGTTTDTVINSGDWNLDKMDGTGISGISIDASKAQIFVVDLEWLGVGRVRCGFVVAGEIHYCHQYLNSNNQDTTYMTRASLPVRYQVSGKNPNGAGKLKMICSTVISEGGYESLGLPFSVGLDSSIPDISSSSDHPIIAIRLKNGSERVLSKLFGSSLVSISNANVVYKIYHWLSPAEDPLNGGVNWTSVNNHSAIEYLEGGDISNYNLSNAMVMHQGYMSNNADLSTATLDRTVNITADIDGNSDIIGLFARSLGNNESIAGSLQWSEYHI